MVATSGVDEAASSSAVSVNSNRVPTPNSSLVVNVRDSNYGAKGDGATDDTAAIQRAVNAMAGTGGTVMIPGGIYMVNPITVSSVWGLVLGSNMTLSLTSGAIRKAITNSPPNYSVVGMVGCSNVTISGGTITGDRSTHTGTTGEWGMGIYVGTGSTNITIQNLTVKDCWGDGLCVAGSGCSMPPSAEWWLHCPGIPLDTHLGTIP